MKSITLLLVLTSSLQAVASSQLSSLLSERNGDILIAKSLEDANSACQERGMTLPSARELAQMAMQRGAVGITEMENAASAPEGSYEVAVYTPGQAMDRFLYSNEGYKASREDAEASCLWTSSLNPKHPLTYHEYLVTFKPSVGAIHTQTSDYRNTIVSCAVVCKK